MYAAKPKQTIDDALALLRTELEQVSGEAEPLTPKDEIPTSELLRRGWTRTLIRRFMPEADGRHSVDHWANFQGTPTYFVLRVWEIEQSEEFGKAFVRSWKGRMKGRKPEDALAKLRETPKPE